MLTQDQFDKPEINISKKYIAAWGLGGCYSGYPYAAIVYASSTTEAYGECYKKAFECNQLKGKSIESGMSFLVLEYIEEFSRLPCLKSSAIKMIENKTKKGISQKCYPKINLINK